MVALRPTWQLRPRIEPLDDRLGADPAVRPDDRSVDRGPFLDVGLAADHRVGQDAAPLLDHGAFVDEAGAV